MIRQLCNWLTTLAMVMVATTAVAQPQTLQQIGAEVETLKSELAALQAEKPTLAASVDDAASRLAVLEQRLAVVEKQRAAIPDAIATTDELTADLLVIRADIEALRTRLADVEQPAVGSSGLAGYDGGFRLRSPDGRHALRFGGYFQFRTEWSIAEDQAGDFDYDRVTLGIRRARMDVDLSIHAIDVSIVFDPSVSRPLLDYFLRAPIAGGDRWSLTGVIGQYRAPFTRNFSTRARDTIFSERPSAVEDLRYDRSPSVGIEGSALGGRLWAYLGFSNAGGRNALNDNIELATTFRVEAAALGERPSYSYGDGRRSTEPVLVFGAGVVHDLSAIPSSVAGVTPGVVDVDGDGDRDNVRVVSVSADALFRLHGFELAAEGIFRHERWGTFFDHPDNTDVGDLFEFDDKRNYIGFYGDASYLITDRSLIALRGGHVRRAPLRLDGRALFAPPTSDRRFEARAAFNRLWPGSGRRFATLEYSYRNDNNKDAPEVPNDEEHRLVGEIQLVW